MSDLQSIADAAGRLGYAPLSIGMFVLAGSCLIFSAIHGVKSELQRIANALEGVSTSKKGEGDE